MKFDNELDKCIKVLGNGGLILYPTDTVWGIGCDATNEEAVKKIFTLKRRAESKSMILLLSSIRDIPKYVDAPDKEFIDHLSKVTQPTTAIYDKGKNVATGLINGDGTIAIRITKDEFCTALIDTYKKPVVSTSANVSGMPAPGIFKEITAEIKNGVDYIVKHRQSDSKVAKPSVILKLDGEKKIVVIRP